MKYIFLDVDGVLNSEEMLKHKPYPKCHGLIGIEKSKVKLLKAIIDATGAKIVLTSSWKTSFDAFKRNRYKVIQLEDSDLASFWPDEIAALGYFGKYLSNKLYEQKLRVFDTTTKYEQDPNRRGDGILRFLVAHPAESYVILDDETFRDYNKKEIADHLVLTDFMVGLSTDDVEKAITILLNNV